MTQIAPPLSVATDTPPAEEPQLEGVPGQIRGQQCDVRVLLRCACGHTVGVIFTRPDSTMWACEGCGRVAEAGLAVVYVHTPGPQLVRPDGLPTR